jgi:hypothetical protein
MLTALLLLAIAPRAVDHCFVEDTRGGVTVMAYIGDRACVDFKPPRLYHGLFVDNFEGQAYYDGAGSLADLKDRKDRVWFSTDGKRRFRVQIPGPRYRGTIYRVTFRGREAKNMGRKPLEGYGHMSMSAGVVLVDELKDVVMLEQPRD